MKCPSCGVSLRQRKYHGLIVDICRECGGIWFDPGEMKDYIDFFVRDHDTIPDAEIRFDREIASVGRGAGVLKACPRCYEPMKEFNYAYDSNVILDRCPRCSGIWTDGGEIRKLAIYVKGNPRLDALGDSIIEDRKKADGLADLAELSGALTGSAAAWVFLPKIVLPLGDDTPTRTTPGVVYTIMAVNILVYLYQLFMVSDMSSVFAEHGLVPSRILAGEGYLSLVSSMFIHCGFLHLAGNMLFLWIFGDNIEEACGHLRFAFVYLLFGFFASALHIFTNTQLDVPAVGASGAIAGVMGAYLVLLPRAKIKTFFVYRVVDIPAYLFLGAWAGLQVVCGAVYLSAGARSGPAWWAHIGGFVSGLVFMLLYRRSSKRAA